MPLPSGKPGERNCDCDAYHIYLYLVWKFDSTTNFTDLVAICRTREQADRYANAYKGGTRRSWVDIVISDHLMGSTMFGNRR